MQIKHITQFTRLIRLHFLIVVVTIVLGTLPAVSAELESVEVDQPTVFQMLVLREGEQRVLSLVRTGNTAQALSVLETLLDRFPTLANLHYFHAVLLARAGKGSEALDGLTVAVANGFGDANRLESEPSFAALRTNEKFIALVTAAEQNPRAQPASNAVEASLVRDGVATVSSANTRHEPQTNTLQAEFKFRSRLFSEPKVMAATDSVANRLNDLYRSGKAAGNLGDLYDNRDRKHSQVSERFLQIGRIDYAPDAVSFNVDYSFNDKIFFSAPTIGNASLGINGMWSVAKMALANPRMVALAYLQYRTDHVYVYPSVRDYAWPTYGTDNFVANTPYLIISKGKSGSDRPFLEAAFIALAAMPPAVKNHALENGLISPTVQMLLRKAQKHIKTSDDYLSPAAHPVVFDGENLDLAKIIDIAQTLTVENLPPRTEFTVLEESGAEPEAGHPATDNVFTTPSAVARSVSRKGASKSITISMATTKIQIGKKAIYHWRVLEGNPNLISIKHRNETGSVAEIEFQWHPRQASLSHPEVLTDRADVGIFVEIDGVVSAPAFVSVHFPKS